MRFNEQMEIDYESIITNAIMLYLFAFMVVFIVNVMFEMLFARSLVSSLETHALQSFFVAIAAALLRLCIKYGKKEKRRSVY